MLTPEQIKLFIENDRTSPSKQAAQQGQDYYDGKHDIRERRIFYVNADNKLVEDKVNSNIRISHPFFTENVDQKVQYVLSGKDGFIRSDKPELQEILDERFNENDDFIAELYEVLTGSAVKGFDYFYYYKDNEGKTVFECADGLGVVEVRAKETDDRCEYLIRHYVDRVDAEGHQIKRIEVWDAEKVTFFTQVDDGEITFDDDEEVNPRPHTLYTKKGDKKTYRDKGYEAIPFIKLPNNRKETSDLVPIKDIIDDYDLMNVDLSNTLQDTNTSLYVIKGFDGDNLDELILNIRNKKHVGVPEEGDVDIKTVDIPVEARKVKMDIDVENIYRFGMAMNPNGLKDTAAKTSIEIKSMYVLLDLKANKTEIRLKQFLRKCLDVVLAEINAQGKTDYSQKDVYFVFEREIPSNALENAQIELYEAQKKQAEINIILDLQTFIDDETRLQLICEQLDIDFEKAKEKMPKEDPLLDPAAAQTALANAPIEPEVIAE